MNNEQFELFLNTITKLINENTQAQRDMHAVLSELLLVIAENQEQYQKEIDNAELNEENAEELLNYINNKKGSVTLINSQINSIKNDKFKK